jgi:hypothetical protein
MSERLREYALRGWVRAEMLAAGRAWYGDWQVAGRVVPTSGAAGTSGGQGGADIMLAAARERLRAVEAQLGGREAPWFKVAHHVVLLDQPAGEVAAQLKITPRSAMDVLRLALAQVAAVYRLREVA